MKKNVEVEIPRRKEEIGEVIARHVRSSVWDVVHATPLHRVLFVEAFRKVKEVVMEKFPEMKTFRRDLFISSCLALGSNIAFISTGAELYITYAHLIGMRANPFDF